MIEQSLVPLTRKVGYVYLVKIRVDGSEYYKIGYSTNLVGRMYSICSRSLGNMELLFYGYTAHPRKTEHFIHHILNTFNNIIYCSGRHFWWSFEYYRTSEIDIKLVRELFNILCLSVEDVNYAVPSSSEMKEVSTQKETV